ncbi:Aromatic-amino-acid aminotransferase [plant metagenome]|uniref:Aromatic-amino-acid aminotransferase n=1 Tax=plant metagenome TaxID=1297885 RepID=A0A484VBZ4_9ZZZZ
MISPFASVELAPRDPILGLTEQYNADTRPGKVNLGVGVYYDDEGRIPLLQSVRRAEQARLEAAAARGYLPIDGIANYNQGAQKLLLGEGSPLVAEGRVLTVQTLGGTGALKVGADFLRAFLPDAKVAISDPSWENHRALFERAGFEVVTYAYYDAATRGLNFAGMTDSLRALPEGSIVVLHACCHNPTGVDPTAEQWAEILEIVKARKLVPFMDIAYQGFGDGLEQDAQVVRRFADAGLTMLISSSFSKSFSLYGERVGALTVVAGNKEETGRVLSQVKRTIRTNYSNPPTHGASVVAAVLNSPELFKLWDEELAGMRDRIRLMRQELVNKVKAHGATQDLSFVVKQRGMFSYSGLSAAQVETLREESGIYALSTGRICVAALNSRNIDVVAAAIAKALK